MRIEFIRHATLVFEADGVRVLVDPMLGPAGADEPVVHTSNRRHNPLVDLPFGDEINHCLLSRKEIGVELEREGLLEGGEIPADGEPLVVP